MLKTPEIENNLTYHHLKKKKKLQIIIAMARRSLSEEWILSRMAIIQMGGNVSVALNILKKTAFLNKYAQTTSS